MLTFTPSPETFTVEEIPAYAPSGEGTHLFLWIEKRGLTTFDAIARIARALDVAPRDIGYAGLKDRHALTRQQLSVPGLAPARALEIASPTSRSRRRSPTRTSCGSATCAATGSRSP